MFSLTKYHARYGFLIGNCNLKNTTISWITVDTLLTCSSDKTFLQEDTIVCSVTMRSRKRNDIHVTQWSVDGQAVNTLTRQHRGNVRVGIGETSLLRYFATTDWLSDRLTVKVEQYQSSRVRLHVSGVLACDAGRVFEGDRVGAPSSS